LWDRLSSARQSSPPLLDPAQRWSDWRRQLQVGIVLLLKLQQSIENQAMRQAAVNP
jgi:hypothetical protein